MSTPAPRKFSNPSSDRYKTPASTWRKPGSALQGPLLPSSLKQPPSKQFAKRPHFARSSWDDIDDIGTSLEEPNSPTDVRNPGTNRVIPGHHDDLPGANDGNHPPIQHSHRAITGDQVNNCELPRSDAAKLRDTIQDFDENDFSQAASKRFKTSSESTRHRDANLILSSGPEDEDLYDKDPTDENFKPTKVRTGKRAHAQDIFSLDSNSDLEDDLLPSSATHTRPSTASALPRFKHPAPPRTDNQQPTKPVFKPPLPYQFANDASPLPETFSPSRRRGRRDYIAGGHANTVRNWVLELAARESRSKEEMKSVLRVVEVRHDVEGRAATVLNEEGEDWLLVSQGQQSDTGNITVGDLVELSGGGTSWKVDIDGVSEGSATVDRRNVNVSVIWKVRR